MRCHFLLQGICPTQGLNSRLLCLLPWQADPLQPGHLGSPYMCKYTHTLLKTPEKWHVVTNICAQNRHLYNTHSLCCVHIWRRPAAGGLPIPFTGISGQCPTCFFLIVTDFPAWITKLHLISVGFYYSEDFWSSKLMLFLWMRNRYFSPR